MQKSKKMHDKLFIVLERILSSSFLRHVYINFFEKATLEEFDKVEINENERIIHIGCGPLPNTLITLAKYRNAKYFGIDKDKKSTILARKVIEEYDLENIIIEEGDALDYSFENFDIIIISFGVEPKEVVFEKIRKETKKDVIIIFRKQWDFMDLVYGRKDFIPHGFKVLNYHHRRDMLKSYILQKYN